MMKIKTCILFCLTALTVFAQSVDVVTLAALSRQKSIQAQVATDKSTKGKLAKAGLNFAEQCLKIKPDDVSCLYYRAINRGLDLETRFINIKNDVHRMKADFERVASLDSSFDDAGANRALGFLFLQAPAVPILGKDIRKNVAKSMRFAKLALTVAPNNAENILLMAQIQIEQDDYAAAKKNLLLAEQNLASMSTEDQIRLRPEIQKYLVKVGKRGKVAGSQ